MDPITAATLKAAVRLIRVRLHRHLIAKARGVRLSYGSNDTSGLDRILDIEASREFAAESSWVSLLGLWRDSVHDDPRARLRALVGDAVLVAVKESTYFIRSTWGSNPYEDVKAWVEQFLDDFDEETLVAWIKIDELRDEPGARVAVLTASETRSRTGDEIPF
jgi:hypothetical protein